jgi:hypothetical protein
MKRDELYSTILGCSVSGFYKWKKQNRLIISLLQEYFSDSDLLEWVKDQKITKLELIKDFEMILLGSKIDYLKFISENLMLDFKYDLFTDIYYQFLIYLDEMQRSEDLEIYKTWTVGDAIPGFFIKHNTVAAKEDEIYKLQYKFGIVNDFDQNMSNFIRLSLSRDMLPLVTTNIGSNIEMSEAYRKNAVYHALLFNIYKKHPELDYKDKMKFLLELIVPGFKEEDANIIFNNNWKHLEVDFNKFMDKI